MQPLILNNSTEEPTAVCWRGRVKNYKANEQERQGGGHYGSTLIETSNHFKKKNHHQSNKNKL